MWIERELQSQIEQAVDQRPIVYLGGMRQVGKSSLLKKCFPEAEYVTLDRTLLATEAQENPVHFLNTLSRPCIIDEVQYAQPLFKALKILVDENRKTPAQWILTGSQYLHLMQSVSESLAGRIRVLRLLPLSAHELRVSGFFDQTHIDRLIWMGGFPELWASANPISVPEYYEDYIQTYLERDLRQLINVKQLADFRRFMSFLALNVAQMMNYSTISRALGVSVNTIKSWTASLEISGLITLLPPFHRNLGKRIVKTPKIFFNDNGLLCALLSIESKNDLKKHPLNGAIWENLVFTELLKQGFKVGIELFFFRDQNGLEMDFMLQKNAEIHLIEAKRHVPSNVKVLNFKRISSLFEDVNISCSSTLAANIQETRMLHLNEFRVYNPLACKWTA